jgi:glucose-6-phosphate isomerase/transaldolase/glucose-6-phosphate isomerase
MAQRLGEFDTARREMGGRYDYVVLAGMGGSSLCPDVLRNTFGVIPGSPELVVLDSTDPSTITAVADRVQVARTLFLIASKSGGTTETISHFRFFLERVRKAHVEHGSRNFVVITDEGSSLHKLAQEEDLGFAFLNPPDIGGRYSALSYFGLVPAALMGLDAAALIQGARDIAAECRTDDARANPGLTLGAILGVAATSGRDKCTVICSPRIATLGVWLEQLLAESTGKEGRGIIPVAGEPLGAADEYGDDRLFVYLRTPIGCADQDPVVDSLRAGGQPVYTVDVPGPMALGAEFLRWEVATAVAGGLIGINPFDQPNVQESKDNTKVALSRYLETGDFGVATGSGDVSDIEPLLDAVTAGDYFAVLAYTEPADEIEEMLDRIRVAVRQRFGVATTSGYGPRYLHSTGQLHKGGPNTGVYLILNDERGDDLPIPGEKYGFKTLIAAQWAGDLKSLRDHGRRVARVALADDRLGTLERILETIQRAPVAGGPHES